MSNKLFIRHFLIVQKEVLSCTIFHFAYQVIVGCKINISSGQFGYSFFAEISLNFRAINEKVKSLCYMRDKALTIIIINTFDNQINNKPYTTPNVPAAYSQTPDITTGPCIIIRTQTRI